MVYLYSLFVWPFQVCIETFYVVFMKLLGNNTGVSIIFSSVLISICLMPFYSIRPAKDSIPAANPEGRSFLSVRKIRNIFQSLKPYVFIVFYILLFIGVSQYFSNIQFNYPAFWIIEDLSETDSLFGLHYIPVLMLLLAVAGFVVIPLLSNKKLRLQDILPMILFLVFFILLYNASSAVCLFWVSSAGFILVKNCIDSMKHPSRIYQGIILLCCAMFLVILNSKFGDLRLVNSIALLFMAVTVVVITIFFTQLKRLLEAPVFYSMEKYTFSYYAYSCAVLFLVTGLVVPLLLFASSPTEFNSPGEMSGRTLCQSASVFILCAFFYWEFSSRLMRRFLGLALPFLVILSLISCFVFPGDHGILTPGFIFEDWERTSRLRDLIYSIIAVAASILIFFVLLKTRKFDWLKYAFAVITLSFCIISVVNGYSISSEISQVKSRMLVESETKADIYNFSREGENVFILFLDRAAGFAMPSVIKLNPNLEEDLDGFTWYRNTVSFGNNTLFGYPAMIGGYEYRPLQMNERTDMSLKDKVNESIRVIPKMFADAGYQVMVTDPSYSNLSWIPAPSIFDGMENVTSRNISGIFRERFSKADELAKKSPAAEFNYDVTMKFSIFRITLPVLRTLVYSNGTWLKNTGSTSYDDLLKLYPNLLYLKDLCDIDSGGKYLNIMMNDTVHNPGAINRNLELVSYPLVFTGEEIAEYGSGDIAAFIYTYTASLTALANWFTWLKDESIYDNTKIIIIGDHGYHFDGKFLGDETIEWNNPLLLIKDFNSRGRMVTSDEFMTNADLPVLAGNSLGNPVNPYTGNPLDSSPKYGEILICSGSWMVRDHRKNSLIIDNILELKNRNIFEQKNWGRVK